MCVIPLCTRGALDTWLRGRSTAALGVMQRTLANELMETTGADLDAPAELPRAHHFVLDVLMSVKALLPPAVQTTIESLSPSPPAWTESERQRVFLWESIKGDSMGKTAAGAATRAALFAFPHTETESHSANDVIWHFEMFYSRAGLPRDPFVSTFRRYWPSMTPTKSLERTREG